MPTWIEAANMSPPVEIALLDYNTYGGLPSSIILRSGIISYRRYTGRDYYHMAHARNLSVLMSRGDYIMIMSADILLDKDVIAKIRDEINKGSNWILFKNYEGVIVIPRQEFIDAGGYDERFEFYGPEDRDLNDRLARRGNKRTVLTDGVSVIQTPKAQKSLNYRLPISRKKMKNLMKPIYLENTENKALVANEGVEWGQWN